MANMNLLLGLKKEKRILNRKISSYVNGLHIAIFISTVVVKACTNKIIFNVNESVFCQEKKIILADLKYTTCYLAISPKRPLIKLNCLLL